MIINGCETSTARKHKRARSRFLRETEIRLEVKLNSQPERITVLCDLFGSSVESALSLTCEAAPNS